MQAEKLMYFFNMPMPCSLATAAGVNEDTTKDASVGNPIPTVVSGSRGNAETSDSSKMYGTVPPPVAPTNVPAPVTQAIPLLGKFTFVYILQILILLLSLWESKTYFSIKKKNLSFFLAFK